MHVNRRTFLATGAAGLLSGCASFPPFGKKLKLAVQTYVLRDLLKKDLAGTYARIRELGVEGVELWNTPAFDPKTVRGLLDDNGLEVCGAHLTHDMLLPEKIGQTLDYANEVGNRNLIVAWMQPGKDERDVVGWWRREADFYTRAAVTAAERGCRVGYHNHYHEFVQRFGGRTLWEIFMARISSDVVVQLDVGSAAHVDMDPVYWYTRYPGRSPSVHLRDDWNSEKGFPGVVGEPPPGRIGVDWPALFAAMRADPVTEWAVLEPVTSGTFDTLERSIANLGRMGLV